MGLFNRLFNKAEAPELDPLKDLVLDKLRVGFLVDYDLKTWTVTEHSRYSYNDGRRAQEWELTAGHSKRYLEKAEGDDEGWSLSKSIPLGTLSSDVTDNVREHILEHEDPPDQVAYKDTLYYMEGSVGGHQEPGMGGGERQELILWEFLDEDEESFVAIIQWSETEFTAAHGTFVHEYEFSNILPGEAS